MPSAIRLHRRSIFTRYNLSGTITYTLTGGAQTFYVPPGVQSVTVDVVAGCGGDEYSVGNTIPYGARVQATLDVTPGETLNIYVGGAGQQGGTGFAGQGEGGWNGGGDSLQIAGGGGGGGASDIRQGGTALTDRVVVAGGAGGNGGNLGGTGSSRGGDGGQLGDDGQDGIGASPGLGGDGGDASAGGPGGTSATGSNGVDGALGVGGDGAAGDGTAPGFKRSGGGGGGGYYGGGGGGGALIGSNGGGGGGGSSYADPGVTSAVTYTAGFNDDDGYIVISW